MANYTILQKGSSNTAEIKKLQQALKDAGYGSYLGSAGADGIFGSGTAAAVKAYQKDNGLAVDGIAGNQTLGKLYGSASAPEATAPEALKAPTFTYQPSDAILQADALLKEHMDNKPGALQYTWDNQLNDTISQILNGEKFSYDLNGDALYQQYKDQYTTQGKLAMMDTMGQAAALTGGYGNSYAQGVGQQAYQDYLQQLNDRVPELYQLARSQYDQERQDLYNQASVLTQMKEQAYREHRDEISDYYTDLNYLTDNARYLSETEYQKALEEFNIKHGMYRDSVSDEQWQKSFDEGVRQYEDSVRRSSSSGGGSIKSSDGSYSNGNTGSNDATSVSDSIRKKAASFTNNNDLANYLDGLENAKVIDESQNDALFAEFKQPDEVALSKRSWTLEHDGGVNWFWGIDNNATVKDQYGNIYRLDKLIDALVSEGMSKSDAKAYVKKLQAQLGA